MRYSLPSLAIVLFFSATCAFADPLESLQIERSESRLSLHGVASSAAHEDILLKTIAELYPDLDLEVDLSIGGNVYAEWVLVTNFTLRALAYTQSSVALINQYEVSIEGYANQDQQWKAALSDIRRVLPENIELSVAVVTLSNQQSLQSMCRQLFAGVLRERKVEYAKNSSELSSNAFGLLDELAQLAGDCPDAKIVISSSGGQQNQLLAGRRATAVAEYLEHRGISAERLATEVSGAPTSTRIVFSVSF